MILMNLITVTKQRKQIKQSMKSTQGPIVNVHLLCVYSTTSCPSAQIHHASSLLLGFIYHVHFSFL